MKRIWLIGLLIYIVQLSQAQELHVFYDVYHDSVYYVKDGERVQSANVKKGEKAILHVVNYNDFLYRVEINTEGRNYSIPSSGVGNIFSLQGGQDAINELKEAAGSFGIPGFQLQDYSFTGDRDGAVDTESNAPQGLVALSKRYEQILKDMTAIEEEIEELGEDIESKIEDQQYAGFKKAEVVKLRTNPRLSATKIKEISLQYLADILGIEEGETMEIEDLFDKADPAKSIGPIVRDYKIETNKLESKFTELSTINTLLAAFDLSASNRASIITSYSEAEKRKNNYREKAARMEEQVQTLSKWELAEFADLNYMYEEMKDHRFEKKLILRPEDDITNINIKLVPIDSIQIEGVHTQQLTPLELTTFGGLKINASVGISFASFFNRPQAFSVREDRIIADDLDPFTPIVTSFIHFHPQGRRQVSVGGAFGLGISIGGESSGLQTYFLGPSLILGKRQRIIFTTGLMSGKVDRLAQGYGVGDSYLESIIPTRSVYELGFFLGVSFNFMGG